jgi:hypothetical protein
MNIVITISTRGANQIFVFPLQKKPSFFERIKKMFQKNARKPLYSKYLLLL